MFYFKNEPVSPLEIDTVQLAKVHEFRKKLGPKGILYWEFGTTAEFRQLIRIHLSKELQERIPQPEITNSIEINLDELQEQSATRAGELSSVISCHFDALGEHELTHAPQRVHDLASVPRVLLVDGHDRQGMFGKRRCLSGPG